MPLNLDFGEVGNIPEEGTKLLKCILAEVKVGKQAPYIKLQFELLGPDMPGFNQLYLNLSCAQQSLWATQKSLEALTGLEFRDDNMEIDEADFFGLICGGIVTHGEYNGVARPQIDSLVPKEVGEEAMENWIPPEPDDEEPIDLSFSGDATGPSGDEEPF